MKDLLIVFLGVAVIWLTMMLITVNIFNIRMEFYAELRDSACAQDEIDLCEEYIDIWENDLHTCIIYRFFRYLNWPKELYGQIIELQRDYIFMREKVNKDD